MVDLGASHTIIMPDVARAESATEDGLARLKQELAAELGASGVVLPDA